MLGSLDMVGQSGESSSMEACLPPQLSKFLCITELRNALVVCSSFSLVLVSWYLNVAVGWLWSTVSWWRTLPSPLLLETLSLSKRLGNEEIPQLQLVLPGPSSTRAWVALGSSHGTVGLFQHTVAVTHSLLGVTLLPCTLQIRHPSQTLGAGKLTGLLLWYKGSYQTGGLQCCRGFFCRGWLRRIP